MFIYTKVHYYNSKNQNNNKIQSAGNEIINKVRSSETIRVLSKKDIEWLAGVLDGDGSFEFRYNKNKIRSFYMVSITQNIRDIRILYKVKDLLKMGRIRCKSLNVCRYILSHKEGLYFLLNLINGEIRLKVDGFKEACFLYNINFKEACYSICKDSSYLAGLVDTDGTIVFNYPGNKIEVHIELKQTIYSLKLDLTQIIEYSNLKTYRYIKRNQTKDKIFYSIRFSFSSISNMLVLYKYFKKNRLYSDFKYYRVMSIKKFLELRLFKSYSKDSVEFKLYKKFLYNFFIHMNQHKDLPDYLSEFR